MRNYRLICLLFFTVFISVCIASCTKTDIDFGSQYIDDNYTQLVAVDTFKPQVSTLYIDSFVTNASGTGLAGVYNDPIFGNVRASSYYELTCPAFVSKTDYTGTLLDSITLEFNTNKSYYGDTTKSLTLNVYTLLNSITYKDNNLAFYNKDSITTLGLIGTKTFNYRPGSTTSVSIRLSDELGQTLLQLYKDKSDDVQSTSNFINYFKGIAIKPDGSDGCMLELKDSLSMHLYYRLKAATKQDSSIVFTFNNKQHQFNSIQVNRSGSPISTISSQNKLISSTATGNNVYVQGITGTIAKLQFSQVWNLLKTPGYTKLAKASLLIKPVNGTFNGFYPLPDSLKLATTDVTNTAGTNLTDAIGAVQYGTLQVDGLYGLNTYYSYDVTSYLTSVLAQAEKAGDGLLLSPPANTLNTGFSRLVAGDAYNSQAKMQLIIYYLSIK